MKEMGKKETRSFSVRYLKLKHFFQVVEVVLEEIEVRDHSKPCCQKTFFLEFPRSITGSHHTEIDSAILSFSIHWLDWNFV
jgi:hypothetical protein